MTHVHINNQCPDCRKISRCRCMKPPGQAMTSNRCRECADRITPVCQCGKDIFITGSEGLCFDCTLIRQQTRVPEDEFIQYCKECNQSKTLTEGLCNANNAKLDKINKLLDEVKSLRKMEEQVEALKEIAEEYAEHMYKYGDDPIYSNKLHKKIEKILGE